MAREVGAARLHNDGNIIFGADALERFAALVAAAEREACAKVLDEMAAKDKLTNYYKVAALTIRERGAP
jgi:cytidine deaminase